MQYSGANVLLAQNKGVYTLLTLLERFDIAEGRTDKKRNVLMEHIEVIEKDLHRTFPENIKFKPTASSSVNAGIDLGLKHLADAMNETMEGSRGFNLYESTVYIRSLRNVLVAFAYYTFPHPVYGHKYFQSKYKIGYCQGLNFLAGLMLIVFSYGTHFEENALLRMDIEEKVFWLLVAFVDLILPVEMYGASLQGSQLDQMMIWEDILKKKAKLWGLEPFVTWLNSVQDGSYRPRKQRLNHGHYLSSTPPFETISTQWFLTCFINAFPVETLLRVWDVLTYDGYRTLVYVMLALLKMNQDKIISFDEPIESWKCAKDISKRIYDEQQLFHAMYGPEFGLDPTEMDVLHERLDLTDDDLNRMRRMFGH